MRKKILTVVLMVVTVLALTAMPASAAKYKQDNWGYWGKGTHLEWWTGWTTEYVRTNSNGTRNYLQYHQLTWPVQNPRLATCKRYHWGTISCW